MKVFTKIFIEKIDEYELNQFIAKIEEKGYLLDSNNFQILKLKDNKFQFIMFADE